MLKPHPSPRFVEQADVEKVVLTAVNWDSIHTIASAMVASHARNDRCSWGKIGSCDVRSMKYVRCEPPRALCQTGLAQK